MLKKTLIIFLPVIFALFNYLPDNTANSEVLFESNLQRKDAMDFKGNELFFVDYMEEKLANYEAVVLMNGNISFPPYIVQSQELYKVIRSRNKSKLDRVFFLNVIHPGGSFSQTFADIPYKKYKKELQYKGAYLKQQNVGYLFILPISLVNKHLTLNGHEIMAWVENTIPSGLIFSGDEIIFSYKGPGHEVIINKLNDFLQK